MAWFILLLSGVFEAVWAVALSKSDGFTKLLYVVVFFVALAISMAGLAYAMKTIPVGVAYAVWVGIGAVLVVCYSMVTGAEAISVAKLLLIIGVIGSVVGLKVIS